MALLFKDYCVDKELDLFKVIKILLIHDIVEVYTGDTFLFNQALREQAKPSEALAANQIFGLLPAEQNQEFLSLWHEFEARTTAEARYAAALDNLQPILNHLLSGNPQQTQISKSEVIAKKEFIKQIAPELWTLALQLIDESVAKGLFLDH
ncbi:MAG: hypothetical protein RL571_462 [Pseudomonadota bacterium]|jgi:putative hydrolase of HD superfamily